MTKLPLEGVSVTLYDAGMRRRSHSEQVYRGYLVGQSDSEGKFLLNFFLRWGDYENLAQSVLLPFLEEVGVLIRRGSFKLELELAGYDPLTLTYSYSNVYQEDTESILVELGKVSLQATSRMTEQGTHP